MNRPDYHCAEELCPWRGRLPKANRGSVQKDVTQRTMMQYDYGFALGNCCKGAGLAARPLRE